MQITTQRSNVTTNMPSKGFGMEVNARSFNAVFKTIYNNPIQAFIRELSTNAYEAHQVVGKENIPFDVTLPSFDNANFVVRDYGPGLDDREIHETYTVAFRSTKNDSNVLGGGFGLGSKSPFAYTSTFNIVSIKGGKKYSYVCFKGPDGDPQISDAVITDTYEPSGVQVSVPVKAHDFNNVYSTCQWLYSWFDTVPNISGGHYTHKNYQSSIIGNRFRIINEIHSPHVKMGNIVYPIDQAHVKTLGFERCGLVVEVPIGSVNPNLGRESLVYDNKTVANLTSALKKVRDEIVSRITPQIDICRDYFEACKKCTMLISSLPLRITDFEYKGIRLKSYYDSLNGNEDGKGTTKVLNGEKLYSSKKCTLSYTQNVVFMEVDTKSYYIEAVKAELRKNSSLTAHLCYTLDGDSIDSFAKYFGIDKSRIIKTSSIPVEKKKREAVTRNKQTSKIMKWSNSSTDSYSWTSVEVDIEQTSGVFVVYHSNKIMVSDKNGNNVTVKPCHLQSVVNLSGYKGDIYGVKPSLIERMESTGKWKNFLDFVEQSVYNKLATINKDSVDMAKQLLGKAATAHSSFSIIKCYALSNITSANPDVINTINEVKKLMAIANGSADVEDAKIVCENFYHKPIVSKNVLSSDIMRMCELLDRKYPLLGYIRSYQVTMSVAKELEYYMSAIFKEGR